MLTSLEQNSCMCRRAGHVWRLNSRLNSFKLLKKIDEEKGLVGVLDSRVIQTELRTINQIRLGKENRE